MPVLRLILLLEADNVDQVAALCKGFGVALNAGVGRVHGVGEDEDSLQTDFYLSKASSAAHNDSIHPSCILTRFSLSLTDVRTRRWHSRCPWLNAR